LWMRTRRRRRSPPRIERALKRAFLSQRDPLAPGCAPE
jgi:hypothetical protein